MASLCEYLPVFFPAIRDYLSSVLSWLTLIHLVDFSGDEDDEHVNVVDGDEEDMMPSAKRRRVQESQRNVLEEGKGN